MLRRVAGTLLLLLAVAVTAWAGGDTSREMAVTFDDLPAVRLRDSDEELTRMTGRLLSQIADRGIPVIGFVNEGKLYREGTLDDARVELLKLWCEAGHELGNHTYSHMDLHRSTLTDFQQDIVRGEAVTRPLLGECGMTLRYFRHPMLHTGRDLETKHAVEQFLEVRGYRIAPVTIDNSEWIFAKAYDDARQKNDTDTMTKIADQYLDYMVAMVDYYEQQSRALFGREIPQVLLLHANHLNADHFGRLADTIAKRGYRWVTLDDAIADSAYRSLDEFTGSGGITWIHRWAITAGKSGEFFGDEPMVPRRIADAAGVEY